MNDRLILGVAGGSGSGKTTVVEEILRSLQPTPISVIHHDSYYRDLVHLPFEERAETNFDHPDALETSLLVKHLAFVEGSRTHADIIIPEGGRNQVAIDLLVSRLRQVVG